MQERAERKRFPFDYLTTRRRSWPVRSAPSARPRCSSSTTSGCSRYHGAIDDNRDQRSVRTQYLRDALGALLRAGNRRCPRASRSAAP